MTNNEFEAVKEIKEQNEAHTLPNTDNAANDGCNKQSERLFTQSELEALISERMKRERKNARSLNSVKELLNTLKQSGVIKGGSYPDMANQLLTRFTAENTAESVIDTDADNCGYEKEKELSYTLADTTEQSAVGKEPEQAQNQPLTDTVGQNEAEGEGCGEFKTDAGTLFEFKKLYPDADLNEIFGDEAFLKFAEGRKGELHEVYGAYNEFIESFKRDNYAFGRRMYAQEGSTAFSGDSKALTTDYSQRLTRRQMDIANSCGMSYREYGELLSSIPDAPKRNLY